MANYWDEIHGLFLTFILFIWVEMTAIMMGATKMNQDNTTNLKEICQWLCKPF